MPKLTWPETHWLAGTGACQQGGTQRKGSLFLQPSLTFQNYTSSCEMQNVCAFIYRYTHTLNSRGSFLMSVTLPALQGGIWAPDQTLPLLPTQRAQLSPSAGSKAGTAPCQHREREPRPIRMTWRTVALIPNLTQILWGCKGAPPVPPACTAQGKELSRALLLYNGSYSIFDSWGNFWGQ